MYIFYGLPTGAHGATDVTGFGLLGHAQNLASAQKASVSFRIHTLPGTYKNTPIHCTCTFGQLLFMSTNFQWVLLLAICNCNKSFLELILTDEIHVALVTINNDRQSSKEHFKRVFTRQSIQYSNNSSFLSVYGSQFTVDVTVFGVLHTELQEQR